MSAVAQLPVRSYHANCKRGYASLLLRQFPDAETENLWRAFLGGRMGHLAHYPAHYDSPEFFLEPYWKNENPFALLIASDNQIVAALTGFDQGNEVVSGLASRPQILIATSADASLVSQALADALVDHFPSAKLITVFAWASTPLSGFPARGFRKLELEGNAYLDLRPGAQALYDAFDPTRHRNLRKATRRGVAISEAVTAEDIEDYWQVYTAWQHTTRKQIHHSRDFAMLAAVQDMRGNHRRFLARHEGKLIAATGVRFYPGGLVEYANNCSLDEYLSLRPNDLLMWTILQWACQTGFPAFSFGGAHPFLCKWGGAVTPIHRYRLDRSLFHRTELKDWGRRQAGNLVRRLPLPVQKVLRSWFAA